MRKINNLACDVLYYLISEYKARAHVVASTFPEKDGISISKTNTVGDTSPSLQLPMTSRVVINAPLKVLHQASGGKLENILEFSCIDMMPYHRRTMI